MSTYTITIRSTVAGENTTHKVPFSTTTLTAVRVNGVVDAGATLDEANSRVTVAAEVAVGDTIEIDASHEFDDDLLSFAP